VEDGGEGFAIGDFGFGFYAMLMTIFPDAGVGEAFVGDDPSSVIAANADEFFLDAEVAAGCVVERVALEVARCDEVEAD